MSGARRPPRPAPKKRRRTARSRKRLQEAARLSGGPGITILPIPPHVRPWDRPVRSPMWRDVQRHVLDQAPRSPMIAPPASAEPSWSLPPPPKRCGRSGMFVTGGYARRRPREAYVQPADAAVCFPSISGGCAVQHMRPRGRWAGEPEGAPATDQQDRSVGLEWGAEPGKGGSPREHSLTKGVPRLEELQYAANNARAAPGVDHALASMRLRCSILNFGGRRSVIFPPFNRYEFDKKNRPFGAGR